MLREVVLFLTLTAPICSLKCAFSVSAAASELDVTGGVDHCQPNDKYCVTFINFNNMFATGCSLTPLKITGPGWPALDIKCKELLEFGGGCNGDNTVCCCTGEMCNSATGTEILAPLVTLAAARMLL